MAKTIHMYVFELRISSLNKYEPKFTKRCVEVKETPKQFRTVNPKEDLTSYRTIVNKTEKDVLITSAVCSRFELMTEKDDIEYFKEKIIKHINNQRENLLSKINDLNNQENIVRELKG